MKKDLRILVVEDSEDDTRILIRELERGGFADRRIHRQRRRGGMRMRLGICALARILSILPLGAGEVVTTQAQEDKPKPPIKDRLNILALKKSCIHFALPDGRLIPFESYNLFYRDKRAATVDRLRAELDQFHHHRRSVSLHPVP